MDRALRRALAERLARLDDVAAHPSARLPLVRDEIQRVTAGWRELLVAHLPDARGRCPICSGWVRRRRWPCPVWLAAHRQLLGDDRGGPVAAETSADDQGARTRNIEVIARAPVAPEPRRADAPTRSAPIHPAPIHRAAVIDNHVSVRSLQPNARQVDSPGT